MKVAIIGAGVSGITSAHLLKEYDRSIEITIFEQNNEVGGNCYDLFDIQNNYLQKYGPHIFHTDKKYIWNYLNKFSRFTEYKHKVLCNVDNTLINFPLLSSYIKSIDINIFEKLTKQVDANNAEDYLYQLLGKEITDKFFKLYSEKQWGVPFNKLPVEIVKRIPIRETDNPYYFNDSYQGIPEKGFTELLYNILSECKIIPIFERVSFDTVKGHYDLVINTSEPDIFFNYKFGNLKYRSIRFDNYQEDFQQENSVINYPDTQEFTRITDYNYFLHSNWKCKEFPNNEEDKKCYPIFWDEDSKLNYQKYQEYAKENKVILLGRLGAYKYLNIDAAIDLVFNTLTDFDSMKVKEKLS